jgi:uncharacterized iron-regulated membrane protein
MQKKRSRAQLWFLWHSWLAMPLWAFLLFVCVSGTIAVMSNEIMWLTKPEMRASGAASAVPVKAMIAAAEATLPEARAKQVIWRGDHMAVEVRLESADGRHGRAWVNPRTGTVQGVDFGPSFQSFFRALHGWLLTYPIGWYAVSLLGLPLLGSLITGLVVYKRFWRALYQPRIRFNRGARILWGDLHRVGGAWALWFIALMSITGLWFLINTALWNLGKPLGGQRPEVRVERQDVPNAQHEVRTDPDRLLAAARAAVPGSRLTFLSLPESAYAPARVGGVGGQMPLLPDTVLINPYTYQVMEVAGGLDRPPAQALGIIMRALHTGDFGGLTTKIIWCLFGLVLSILVLSGMIIWTKRTVKASIPTRRSPQIQEVPHA